MEELLSQLDPDVQLGSVSGDGAYDTRDVYWAVCSRGVEVIVPPRRNGMPQKDRADFAQARNATSAALGCGYGRSGRATIGVAWLKQPYCASSCRVNDWHPANRNAKWPRSMYAARL